MVWKVEAKAYIQREKGEPKLKKDGTEIWRVTFKTNEELRKFLIIIMPYIEVKEMLNKIILRYTDAERQQR